MKEWYKMSKKEIWKELGTGQEGLSVENAAKRLAEHGENTLQEGKKKSTLQVFAGQFCDLLVIILIAAAVISMLSGNVESTVVILAVILLNAVLGTVQHVKAEKSLDSLKSLSSPNAKVLRNHEKIEIPARQVVPGDILLLEAGDLAAADGRILENYSLQVNESSLTGESTNVDKSEDTIMGEAALADRINMVYSGSLITYGRAVAVVTETGMDTEIGKIAKLMNDTKEKKTPLQISLDQFSSRLAVIILIICAIVFGLSLYRKMPVLDSLMFAVALAVAAIPEALGSIVTIVQALGTQKMAKENAIIKDLKAVESLGCVSVICSDKTGTLTQNKMTVRRVCLDGNIMEPEKLDRQNPLHRYFLYNAVLNNDSSIVDGKGIGDPTEFALLEMAETAGIDYHRLREQLQRLEELPFDSDRKLMSTKYCIQNECKVFTKGALDVLLERCGSVLSDTGIKPMTEKTMSGILSQNIAFSEQGLRVLAFGYKEVGKKEELNLESERGFTFLGLAAMVDPPREESAAAVADALKAGIKPVMITGDHKVTAAAIAKQIGIFRDGDMAVIGPELDAMSDEILEENIERISVYARVSPENKIRIVEAWQKKGHIVSMTGDGVNDAPALKKADIGVAMGITGTEVSKDAASMILADDNFATIIKAVANGRNVYKNIRNAIMFLLSGNMAAIITVVYTSLMALPIPFQPVHLLFINLLTDSLPAIAIGMEPADKDLLSQKPRNAKEGILTKEFLRTIFFQGGLIAVSTILAFTIGLKSGAAYASTMAFLTLALARLLHGFNCRSKYSIFHIGFQGNKLSLYDFLIGIVLLITVMAAPFMRSLFAVQVLTGEQFIWVAALALAPTIILQAYKIVTVSAKPLK